jgi:hypothetical protein
VATAEVQRTRARAALHDELQPRNAATQQVGLGHLEERPLLQVLSLNGRVEHDSTTARVQSHAELDVLDGCPRETRLVEAAERLECVPSHRTEAGPEGRRRSRAFVVDVVVQEVAERRDDAVRARIVVVGAEDRRQLRVDREGVSNPPEDVRMHLDVRVDEHEHIAHCPARPEVARRGGADPCREFDDDDLVRRIVRAVYGEDDLHQRGRTVGRRDDDGETRHLFSVGWGVAVAR